MNGWRLIMSKLIRNLNLGRGLGLGLGVGVVSLIKGSVVTIFSGMFLAGCVTFLIAGCAEETAPVPVSSDLVAFTPEPTLPATEPTQPEDVKPRILVNDEAGGESNLPTLQTPAPDTSHPAVTTPGSGITGLQAKLDKVTAALPADVVSFFQSNCKSCHASGASNASFWSIDFEGLTVANVKDVLRVDADAHVVFQSILNAVEGYQKPVAMPFGVNLEGKPEIQNAFLRVIKWYTNEIPEVPVNAYLEFKHVNPFGDDVSVKFDHQCKSPVSFRSYLARFTFDALGRYPTQKDYDYFAYNTDLPVTKEMREAVTKRLAVDKKWREEFFSNGLLNFALKLSGANDIQNSGNAAELPYKGNGEDVFTKAGFTEAEAKSLRLEYYQLLLLNFDKETGVEKKRYEDLLLGNEIFVNQDTHRLYGCPGERPNGWVSCDISLSNSIRRSYFTSYSYLSSKPSSMLVTNNNYGRVAMLYFFIRGQSIKAATNGPQGEDIEPLPTCLKSNDTRGEVTGESFAPFGTLQIPKTGNFCQSCHIDRNLANGSLLFRPFGAWGQIYKPSDFESERVSTLPGLADALAAKLPTQGDVTKTVDLTPAFFKNLLDFDSKTASEKACVMQDDKAIELKSVSDLAKILIGDGKMLASGMARHIPRGVSNINSTNLELILEMQKAYENGGGLLMPMFQAYFASETFGCGNQ